MKAALASFQGMQGKKKVVILGDMFELGDISKEEHEKIGILTKNSIYDQVILCGTEMGHARDQNPRSIYFPDKTSLESFLGKSTIKGSYILVKGSRGMGLETVLKYLKS